MELKSENKATLKAILDDLEMSKIPVDLPKIERSLIAILGALLREPQNRTD
jgi:hypothetical protein